MSTDLLSRLDSLIAESTHREITNGENPHRVGHSTMNKSPTQELRTEKGPHSDRVHERNMIEKVSVSNSDLIDAKVRFLPLDVLWLFSPPDRKTDVNFSDTLSSGDIPTSYVSILDHTGIVGNAAIPYRVLTPSVKCGLFCAKLNEPVLLQALHQRESNSSNSLKEYLHEIHRNELISTGKTDGNSSISSNRRFSNLETGSQYWDCVVSCVLRDPVHTSSSNVPNTNHSLCDSDAITLLKRCGHESLIRSNLLFPEKSDLLEQEIAQSASPARFPTFRFDSESLSSIMGLRNTLMTTTESSTDVSPHIPMLLPGDIILTINGLSVQGCSALEVQNYMASLDLSSSGLRVRVARPLGILSTNGHPSEASSHAPSSSRKNSTSSHHQREREKAAENSRSRRKSERDCSSSVASVDSSFSYNSAISMTPSGKKLPSSSVLITEPGNAHAIPFSSSPSSSLSRNQNLPSSSKKATVFPNSSSTGVKNASRNTVNVPPRAIVNLEKENTPRVSLRTEQTLRSSTNSLNESLNRMTQARQSLASRRTTQNPQPKGNDKLNTSFSSVLSKSSSNSMIRAPAAVATTPTRKILLAGSGSGGGAVSSHLIANRSRSVDLNRLRTHSASNASESRSSLSTSAAKGFSLLTPSRSSHPVASKHSNILLCSGEGSSAGERSALLSRESYKSPVVTSSIKPAQRSLSASRIPRSSHTLILPSSEKASVPGSKLSTNRALLSVRSGSNASGSSRPSLPAASSRSRESTIRIPTQDENKSIDLLRNQNIDTSTILSSSNRRNLEECERLVNELASVTEGSANYSKAPIENTESVTIGSSPTDRSMKSSRVSITSSVDASNDGSIQRMFSAARLGSGLVSTPSVYGKTRSSLLKSSVPSSTASNRSNMINERTSVQKGGSNSRSGASVGDGLRRSMSAEVLRRPAAGPGVSSTRNSSTLSNHPISGLTRANSEYVKSIAKPTSVATATTRISHLKGNTPSSSNFTSSVNTTLRSSGSAHNIATAKSTHSVRSSSVSSNPGRSQSVNQLSRSSRSSNVVNPILHSHKSSSNNHPTLLTKNITSRSSATPSSSIPANISNNKALSSAKFLATLDNISSGIVVDDNTPGTSASNSKNRFITASVINEIGNATGSADYRSSTAGFTNRGAFPLILS